tara:strand:- start:9280 stop:10221 length:942 start_codon:yes stop_codon:yes gene_type:complete
MLIDAGRSELGWSRIGQFMKCPQLYAYQRLLNLDLIPASALTRGSMGHMLQAHQHAIWGAQQGGVWVDDKFVTDASTILPPREAVVSWCDLNGGHEHLDRMLETFDRYMENYPEPPGRIVAVEYPISAMLGKVNGKWGLWVEQDGVEIEPTPLNCEGHPNHGKPIRLTRRVDMSVQNRAGKTFIWDHKHQARVSPGRSVDAYAIDGGFAAFRIMGKQLYKNFGGLTLNLIQTQAPWKVARPSVPPTPHRDNHFAELLWQAEHYLATLEISGTSHWKWPKSMHETSCYGRYGPCSGIKLCFFGERGLDILTRHR